MPAISVMMGCMEYIYSVQGTGNTRAEHVAEPEELMGFLLEKAFYPAEQERSR